MVKREIELIARGVFLKNNLILLARQKGDTHTFLPGGHIEFGEPAETALIREIKEELGVTARVSHLLGMAENSWKEADGHHQELNLIFVIDIPEFSSDVNPVSTEPHLEFCWQPIYNLAAGNLRPDCLCVLLPRWITRESQWCSSFKKEA
ncbi:MAG: NUDIX domain-containing protein [Ignavibacteria bacterium]|nr:NUDIX domain-containing protein [Ignavibacteria bacterium]